MKKSTKLFKIGEYSKIPSFTITIDEDYIVLRGYNFDYQLVEMSTYGTKNLQDIEEYLLDITAPYYADKVMQWVRGKL